MKPSNLLPPAYLRGHILLRIITWNEAKKKKKKRQALWVEQTKKKRYEKNWRTLSWE